MDYSLSADSLALTTVSASLLARDSIFLISLGTWSSALIRRFLGAPSNELVSITSSSNSSSDPRTRDSFTSSPHFPSKFLPYPSIFTSDQPSPSGFSLRYAVGQSSQTSTPRFSGLSFSWISSRAWLTLSDPSLMITEGVLSKSHLVCLNGRDLVRDLAVPVGPGERVSVIDALVGG